MVHSDNAAFRSVRTGGLYWQVLPEWQEILLDENGLRLDEWLKDGRAEIVKNGPHRTVYRVTLPELRFYVKQNRVGDYRAWLRECIRTNKGRKEWEQALEIASRGVSTVQPLAMGETGQSGAWIPGESYLITQTLDDVRQLNHFITSALQDLDERQLSPLRRRLAVVLGRFLAGLHDAGVVHRDLHAGNILIRPGDSPELFLVDLYAVSLQPPLDWSRSRENLAVFNGWFVLWTNRTDRLRFWKAYCAARTTLTLPGTESFSARELEDETWKSNRRFWMERETRCLENNRYFRRVRARGVSGHVVADLDETVLEPFLRDPDEPFDRSGVAVLKSSRSSTVVELELTIGGVPRKMIYKRFRMTAWHDPLTSLVRTTPALRSWINGHAFLDRHVPTARPLLVLQRRRHGMACEGYLLTEKLEGTVDLHAFVQNLNDLPASERREILHTRINRLAELIRNLHRRHLGHRDLKAANILTSSHGAQDHPEGCWFIDLVGAIRPRRLTKARRVQNLARLNTSFVGNPSISTTDRLRFLLAYLQSGLTGRETWRDWWEAIEAATRAKIDRNQRKGRVLG